VLLLLLLLLPAAAADDDDGVRVPSWQTFLRRNLYPNKLNQFSDQIKMKHISVPLRD
jgi:hypothetical protein